MNYKEKTHRVFNKFFSSFLKDLKEVDDDLRKAVKASYKVIDKTSSEYCDFFKENLVEHVSLIKNEDFNEDVRAKYVCKNITLGTVLDKLTDEKEHEKNIVMNYLYSLLLFAYMNNMVCEDDGDNLFSQVVRVLGHVHNKHYDQYDAEKDDIIDDDIRDIIEKIRVYDVEPKVDIKKEGGVGDGQGGEGFNPSDIMNLLGNSKIASLAKDIANDIDVSALKTENPEDMVKNMLDFSSGNNVLGNIIQKVSSTLNNKISSGEIKHDELLGEAMSMMNVFNDGNNPLASNPLFAQMMKGMKSGKATVKQDILKKGDTRERLRKKLEMRKKNVE